MNIKHLLSAGLAGLLFSLVGANPSSGPLSQKKTPLTKLKNNDANEEKLLKNTTSLTTKNKNQKLKIFSVYLDIAVSASLPLTVWSSFSNRTNCSSSNSLV